MYKRIVKRGVVLIGRVEPHPRTSSIPAMHFSHRASQSRLKPGKFNPENTLILRAGVAPIERTLMTSHNPHENPPKSRFCPIHNDHIN